MAGMTICFGPATGSSATSQPCSTGPTTPRATSKTLDLAERSPSPVWQAHVLHDHARFLAERGATAEAVEMEGRARQLAMFLGMAALAEA